MKYCKACGKPLHETAAHCPHCGAVQNAAPPAVPTPTTHAPGLTGMAVVGLVLGVFPMISLFSTPIWTRSHTVGSAVFAIAALVLGCISTAKPHSARGVGIAAVVVGVLGLLIALIALQPD